MPRYFTSGQAARELRVSVSTLKRWIDNEVVLKTPTRNATGWRLFSETDIDILKQYKKEKKRNGKKFKASILKPV
ncbi:MAG: MerR family transcriptional regulator [bacterium]